MKNFNNKGEKIMGNVIKVIIFSDSHGDVETMRGVTEKEKPDIIIFLGDGIADAEKLSEKYPRINFIKVLGNVDSKNDSENEEWIKFAEICGKRFIITHGHTFIDEFKDYKQTDENRVKSRNDMLKFMSDNNADILLHGHTHEPYINRAQTPDKTSWIMNPGSIRRGGNFPAVYGVLKFDENGIFEWQFKEVK
jgi:putative phosphoesterase